MPALGRKYEVPYICALQLPDKDICFLLRESTLYFQLQN